MCINVVNIHKNPPNRCILHPDCNHPSSANEILTTKCWTHFPVSFVYPSLYVCTYAGNLHLFCKCLAVRIQIEVVRVCMCVCVFFSLEHVCTTFADLCVVFFCVLFNLKQKPLRRTNRHLVKQPVRQPVFHTLLSPVCLPACVVSISPFPLAIQAIAKFSSQTCQRKRRKQNFGILFKAV